MRNTIKDYEECKSQVTTDLVGMNLQVHPYHWELVVRSKELGIPKDDLIILLKKDVVTDEWNVVQQIIDHVYLMGNHRWQSNYVKIERYLSGRYEFRKNIVTDKVEFRKHEDIDFKDVKNYDLNSFHRQLKIAHIPVHQTILPVIINSSFAQEYDPFIEYFDSLNPWDEHTDYLDQIAKTVVTSNDTLWNKVFRKWIVATVGSSIKEEVINHTLIVLSGKQGLGKTRWMEKLIPNRLKSYYYSGIIDPRNKDSLIRLSENFLVNLDELETLNRMEIGELKQVITSGQIKIRRPYARVDETFPRRASLMGSVNTTEFLNDPTGSRRFLSFEVYQIDYEHNINMDNVFAQARYLFEHGFQYYFDMKEIGEITENNKQFQFTPLEEEYLLENFEPCHKEDADAFLNASQVLEKLKELYPDFFYNNGNKMNMGKILTKHGFLKLKKHDIYVYALRERSKPQPLSPEKRVEKWIGLERRSVYEQFLLELDEEKINERIQILSPIVYEHFIQKLKDQRAKQISLEDFYRSVEKLSDPPLNEIENENLKRVWKIVYDFLVRKSRIGEANIISFDEFFGKVAGYYNQSYTTREFDEFDRAALFRIIKDEHLLGTNDNQVIVPRDPEDVINILEMVEDPVKKLKKDIEERKMF